MSTMTLPILNQNDNRKVLSYWLFFVALMVFIMVIIGGLTRLTHSGLSMVSWEPLTGWLPPMTTLDWMEVFNAYQKTPEFKKINEGMVLAEFKKIFWLEFFHRLWGRVIGIVFLFPAIFFTAVGFLKGKLLINIVIIFVFGGLQAFLGWFMVKSGLVDDPDVSQYRLACHLCLALFIFGYLMWLALSLTNIKEPPVVNWVVLTSKFLIVLIFSTVFSGALVAGLDAGFAYNTFPLMDGSFIPSGLLDLTPYYLNFFENIITVQFNHRFLGLLSFLFIFVFWIITKNGCLSDLQNTVFNFFISMSLVQVVLGISTLLFGVPIWLGVLHQAGAVILFGFSIFLTYTLNGHRDNC